MNPLAVARRTPSPLLVRWTFPPAAVALCRTLATESGHPFRFSSGGRHELSVGDVDGEGMVEVCFASVHNYEWVESDGERQKTIPGWTSRLHRAWAMYLLDERMRALKSIDTGDARKRWS